MPFGYPSSIPRRGPTTPDQDLVWAAPISLATTLGITGLFSSPPGTKMFQFPGLSSHKLCIGLWMIMLSHNRVSPFGYPRIVACVRLPEAFRRYLRPSSALYAKTSTVRSSSFILRLRTVNYFSISRFSS